MIESNEITALYSDRKIKKHYALTWADFVSHLQIPESSEDCIIIPCDE